MRDNYAPRYLMGRGISNCSRSTRIVTPSTNGGSAATGGILLPHTPHSHHHNYTP